MVPWPVGLLLGLPRICAATGVYWSTVFYFHKTQQSIDKCPDYLRSNVRQLVHLYALAKTLQIWDRRHYRAATLRHDMLANLQNVAIPGTGVPLSFFCRARWLMVLFIYVLNPLACLVAAVYTAAKDPAGCPSVSAAYRELLLQPSHWLATWRLNSLLAAYHAQVTECRSYSLEDKGSFLLEGERLGLPVAPFIKTPLLFVKHRSIEGGMGIHVFKNFAAGGDWILQRCLRNSEALSRLLPADAPLSTLRVVTASISWLQRQQAAWEELEAQELLAEQQGEGHGQLGAPGERLRAWEGFLAAEDDGQELEQEDAAAAAAAAAAVEQGQRGPLSPALPLSSGVVNTLDPAVPQEDAVAEATAAAEAAAAALRQQQQQQQEEEEEEGEEQPRPAPRPQVPREQQKMWWMAVEPVAEEEPSEASEPEPEQQQQQEEQQQEEEEQQQQEGEEEEEGLEEEAEEAEEEEEEDVGPSVEAVAAVWRAGLSGADTDHKSICYPVDTETGELGRGVSSSHWHKTGWRGLFRVGPSATSSWATHPESGVQVAGEAIPDLPTILRQVESAHRLLVPDVPLVGWDVALTPSGPCLLEMNLSCNFFNATFDLEGYAEMLYEFFEQLEQLERTAALRAIRGEQRRGKAREGIPVVAAAKQQAMHMAALQQQLLPPGSVAGSGVGGAQQQRLGAEAGGSKGKGLGGGGAAGSSRDGKPVVLVAAGSGSKGSSSNSGSGSGSGAPGTPVSGSGGSKGSGGSSKADSLVHHPHRSSSSSSSAAGAGTGAAGKPRTGYPPAPLSVTSGTSKQSSAVPEGAPRRSPSSSSSKPPATPSSTSSPSPRQHKQPPVLPSLSGSSERRSSGGGGSSSRGQGIGRRSPVPPQSPGGIVTRYGYIDPSQTGTPRKSGSSGGGDRDYFSESSRASGSSSSRRAEVERAVPSRYAGGSSQSSSSSSRGHRTGGSSRRG